MPSVGFLVIKYKLAQFSNQLNGYKFALLTTGLLLLILSVIISRLVGATSPPHLHNCQHHCGNLNTRLCLRSSEIIAIKPKLASVETD